ncbi:MAG TPA: AraC family transcriptional regulator [Polyangiales bacterium]|nr:AraC family transcriptional regulator [Polyangiales bacterium]
MPTRAYGRFVFWEGASLWVLGTRPGEGPFPKTDFHAHHAVQVTLGLRGWFSLETRHGQVHGDVVAVAPDTEHALAGEGVVAQMFIDPEGRPGRALSRTLFSGASMVAIPMTRLAGTPAQLLADFEADSRNDNSLIELGRALVAQLTPGSERDERPEARVRKMVAWAAERLDSPVSLAEAAAHVGLSSGRARHLFVEHTGMPFRTYLLWLRLMRAVELFAVGSSLTEAAHGAGFSDSSHLSRTFRRMFGIAADSLRVM